MSTLETTSPIDLAANQARQVLYRFGALALLDPQAGCWPQLADQSAQQLTITAAELLREQCREPIEPLGRGELPNTELDPSRVFDQLPTSAEELNKAYERTFGLLVSGACSPYETEYIDGKFTFQRSQTLGDIAGFYRAFGLQIGKRHPERHDHIVLELEFMALLCDLECRAANHREPAWADRALLCRETQRRFLAEHLAWWAPIFATVLARTAPHPFYARVGEFLASFLPVERDALGVEPSHVDARPTTLEPPDACDGCQLQAN